MRRTVPPSAEIEEQIDELLAVGVGENPRESLSGLAKLGARLIIQRAVEDEFDAWLGRARYDRRPDYQRGLRNYQSGLRNGFRGGSERVACVRWVRGRLAPSSREPGGGGADAWKPGKPRKRNVTTALRAYAALTTSAARGAVREIPPGLR